MSSLSAIPQRRSLRPKKARKPTARAAEAAAMGNYESIPPMTTSSSRRTVSHSSSSSSLSATAANNTEVKKPMRPLTAYHIFFQIEREYIIQTTAGPDADKSIHNNKSYLPDVPRRYRNIKLLSDWYAGPGKRQKRKHRKSHGKIGFLELSRVISKRWATLDSTDPETKQYVTKIAARELDEYKVEMQEFRELFGEDVDEPSSTVPAPRASTRQKKKAKKESTKLISPSGSPRPTHSTAMLKKLYQQQQPMDLPAVPELVLSTQAASAAATKKMTPQEEIDYSICKVSNNGHYLPSPTSGPYDSSDESSGISDEYDPLFELHELDNDDSLLAGVEKKDKRCVSPVTSSAAGGAPSGDVDYLKMMSV